MKTMICLILDRSGSMKGLEKDVIGGVNTFLDDQKKLPDPASIAFVRFDSEAIERFRPMGDLQKCEPLTVTEYAPRAYTPLLDAVGQTIAKLEEDWREHKPDRAIVVIATDGQENASREYTKAKIQALVKAREDSKLWAFIYLGANVDAFAEAAGLGINQQNSAGYQNTAKGIKSSYGVTSAAVGHMRATGNMVAHNLGGDIDEDGNVKKPGNGGDQVQKQGGLDTVAAGGDVDEPWVPPTGQPSPGAGAPWSPPRGSERRTKKV